MTKVFTVYTYHYGVEYKEKFDTLEDALYFAAQDYDHWVAKIVDDKGRVVVDFSGFVAGMPSKDTGKKCAFCKRKIEVKAFPIALLGGGRVLGHICWICLSSIYRDEEDDYSE